MKQHPSAREAAVIGLPDEDFGDRVTAAVTGKGQSAPSLPEEFVKYCKENLMGHKCPKKIFVVERLPRNACLAAPPDGPGNLTSNRESPC